jgi:membrane protein implicated in regulation of membrane protease activity
LRRAKLHHAKPITPAPVRCFSVYYTEEQVSKDRVLAATCTRDSCNSLVHEQQCGAVRVGIFSIIARHNCLVRIAVRIAALALPLLLLGGLLGLLLLLLLLLLALALSLVLGALVLVVLALLALALLRVLSCRGDGRGSKNLGSRSCKCQGRRRAVVSPVEVLVLGVPLGGGLLVGTAEFLQKLATIREHKWSELTSRVPASFIFFFSVATGPMPQRLG